MNTLLALYEVYSVLSMARTVTATPGSAADALVSATVGLVGGRAMGAARSGIRKIKAFGKRRRLASELKELARRDAITLSRRVALPMATLPGLSLPCVTLAPQE